MSDGRASFALLLISGVILGLLVGGVLGLAFITYVYGG